MDAESWREEQRRLRRAIAEQRRASAPAGARVSQAGSSNTPVSLASVIVVCWNAEDVLERCLTQLLTQDHPNYEIIVVDDGSQDRTIEVAEHVLGDRGTIVRSTHNRGCPHARNLGLLEAKGEIVAFIDADGFAAEDWLSNVAAAFDVDDSVGGVASTVFLASNPLLLNGAGGTVNRQGWAADLSMNQSFEAADLASEALYPMGCGMAFRRSAIERVGEFDDRMLNYYDDVDYGIRLWRAGFRVIVAADAWVDHDFDPTGSESARKQLLCERHRLRVVLKHAPVRTLLRWLRHEAVAFAGAPPARRRSRVSAIGWNLRRLPGTLRERRRLRTARRVPDELVDPSWGDAFPAGVPAFVKPRPEAATNTVDAADPASASQMVYGWFPVERVDGHAYRWAGTHAGTLLRLTEPASRLRVDFAHAPIDTGGVDLKVRRLGSIDPLATVWSTHLGWQYIARSVENHPLALPAGDYEVLFSAVRGWSDPPRETRSLGFALTSMSFSERYEIARDGLEMAWGDVVEQLLYGWFEAEHGDGRNYRWGAGRAAAIVRAPEGTSEASMTFRMAPGPIGGVNVSLSRLDSSAAVWSTRIPWQDGDWHEERFPLRLDAGDYVVAFHTEATWSNPAHRDPTQPPENRSLGLALSSLSFGTVR